MKSSIVEYNSPLEYYYETLQGSNKGVEQNIRQFITDWFFLNYHKIVPGNLLDEAKLGNGYDETNIYNFVLFNGFFTKNFCYVTDLSKVHTFSRVAYRYKRMTVYVIKNEDGTYSVDL